VHSPFRGIRIAYLFDSGAGPFNPEQAAQVGYTHLLSDAKRNPAAMKLLEQRMRRDDPAQLERCLQVSNRHAAV
jgi:hypothetical protein